MFENITLSNIMTTLIIVGAVLFVFLLYVAFKLESLAKQFEKQHDMTELRTQIVSEIKRNTEANVK
ncbi:MAG: hypothetical protein C4555_00425 [Dehalococcoidia bacterium]|nr:MAG: hypothetical protein C4555_00425 [Dehalococcoidia bacterium]